MKRPTTYEELVQMSFKIPEEGMEIRRKGRLKGEQNLIIVDKLDISGKVYCNYQGIVSFICNGEEYVTPYFKGVIEILRKEKFEEVCFSMPLSEKGFPYNKELAKKWKQLLEEVKHFHEFDMTEQAVRVTMKRHVEYLPYDIRRKAVEIPIQGYLAYGKNGKVDVRPYIQIGKMQREEYDRLGTYNLLEDVVVIVSNDAKTYLMHLSEGLLDSLNNSGYKRNYRLPVPMANGEKFLDPLVQKKFEES